MKDFQQIINNNKPDNPQTLIKKPATVPKEQIPFYKDLITKSLPYLSPFLLSIATGPFTTVSILLQVTSKGIGSGLQAKIKAAPLLQRHINNGIFGDNRIYEVMTAKNYREGFNRLGKEGIRGIYKGNVTGILLATSNAWLREKIYGKAGQEGLMKGQLISSALILILNNQFVAVATCTLADFITLPLMAAQSRLVLQNSSSNYRTYSSCLSVWRKTKPSLLFSGGSIILFKNILFNLAWIKLIPQSPAYSFVLSTVASHLITYPFITIMRQLQVSEPNVPMMQNRSQSLRSCIKRIWSQGGISGFYRGFLAYGVVHLFMGTLMVQANLRSGYFYE